MANIVPFSFKGELASGTHNFASGGNTFKLALYTANPYTTSSTTKVATSEVSSAGGSNYTAGGNTLTGQSVTATTATTAIDFADTSWSSATFTAAFGAIYDTSASDKLVVVLDFGGNKTATNGTFTIAFPDPATPSNAIISITS
jgi:hypothetical protein|tara:strand:- start:672 stop:1103 length:432 start_codon:yes stop_codon:yes gene_type:complete